MVQAFVLISCEPRTKTKVTEKLDNMQGIRESKQVFGAYDCLVKTRDMHPKEIRSLVKEQIRPINGIRSTLTLNKMEMN